MKISDAKRMLPKFARGLAKEVITVNVLVTRVHNEIQAYYRGENPLTTEQRDSLRDWLQKVQP